MIQHVMPLHDSRDHIGRCDCLCCPCVETLDPGQAVVIHNAWDAREAYERQKHAGRPGHCWIVIDEDNPPESEAKHG